MNEYNADERHLLSGVRNKQDKRVIAFTLEKRSEYLQEVKKEFWDRLKEWMLKENSVECEEGWKNVTEWT